MIRVLGQLGQGTCSYLLCIAPELISLSQIEDSRPRSLPLYVSSCRATEHWAWSSRVAGGHPAEAAAAVWVGPEGAEKHTEL